MTAPEKPWQIEGVSRSQWYRRRQNSHATDASPDAEVSSKSHATPAEVETPSQPFHDEYVVGNASGDFPEAELACWQNPAGRIVLAWNVSRGFPPAPEPLYIIFDVPTAVRLINRMHALAADIIEDTRSELFALST